jgi:hypothetical protein
MTCLRSGTKRIAVRCVLPVLVALLAAACSKMTPTQSVPYPTGGRAVERGSPAQPPQESLTILMGAELLALVTTVKPVNIPLGMAYRFYVGESIRSNLVSTLTPLFRSVEVSSAPLAQIPGTGQVLSVVLRSCDVKVPSSILGTHSVEMFIEYELHDRSSGSVTRIEAKTSGTHREMAAMFTAADWRRFGTVPSSPTAGLFVVDMATAYAVALSRSIDLLVAGMGGGE